MQLRSVLLLVLAAALLAAVSRAPVTRAMAPSRPFAALMETSSARKTTHTPGHVYAVADLHGDLDLGIELFHKKGWASGCTREAAGEPSCKWTAQDTIVVLLGDYVDRGAWSKQMYIWLRNLHKQSEEHVGAKNSLLIPLKGNHEYMMLLGAWTYVSLQDDVPVDEQDWENKGARSKLFDTDRPKNDPDQVGRWVRSLPFYEMIGNTVFTHGGIEGVKNLKLQIAEDNLVKDLTTYPTVASLSKIERSLPSIARDSNGSPSWSRTYVSGKKCRLLVKVLGDLSESAQVFGSESSPPLQESHDSLKLMREDVSLPESTHTVEPLQHKKDVPLEEQAHVLHRMVVGHSRTCGKPTHYRCDGVELYGLDVCSSRYFTYFGVAYSPEHFPEGIIVDPEGSGVGGFVMPLRINCKHLHAATKTCIEEPHTDSPLDSAAVEHGDYFEQATRVIVACALTPPTAHQPLHGLIPPEIRAACLERTERALRNGLLNGQHHKNAEVVCNTCIEAQKSDFAASVRSVIPNQVGISDEKVSMFTSCINAGLH